MSSSDPTIMSEPFRLLVTGSRDWENANRVWGALSALADQVDALTVVHGAAGRGVDLMAHRWVGRQQASGRTGISEEPHPADWAGLGKRAGVVRNAEMVQRGADACWAWIAQCSQRGCRKPQPHGSHGATDCADRAEGADIRTTRWYTETLLHLLDEAERERRNAVYERYAYGTPGIRL